MTVCPCERVGDMLRILERTRSKFDRGIQSCVSFEKKVRPGFLSSRLFSVAFWLSSMEAAIPEVSDGLGQNPDLCSTDQKKHKR